MLITIIAFAIAFFFAANIGASGTAAAMGSAYGSGALASRKLAVILVALFAVVGANLGGEEVVTTISKGIISPSGVTVQVTVIILLSACTTLFIANRMGIPLSTSEVTVGSIVGAGLAGGGVYWSKLLLIVSTWLVIPFLAFAVAFATGRFLSRREEGWKRRWPRLMPHLLTLLLIVTGCYEAFSAGMNNVANAIGPLIGAGVINTTSGIWLGSLFMAAGAIALGGRVLETNGKKITKMTLLQGSIVSFTSGSLIIVASLFGIPAPLTQATTMAIIGVGTDTVGWSLFRKPVVKKIFAVWFISPISSMLLTLALMQWFVNHSVTLLSCLLLPLALGAYLKWKSPSRSKIKTQAKL
ncbi:inorganic phosphate transporter [Paenibacillus sp. J2TS4]|uniref:inorganic phosphate transporter n=1 Tax=Paenibacillus sp. J2TS4 TaxID=2807194 RepID=UPI001B125C8C|nr:inorganic phosphate transporter [Paenibacillus sp. J2TS4]GIP35812.1 sulfate permease CysP [Paenibacillus sp. J2TS4]